MELIYIKLKNGQDIIGIEGAESVGCCNVENPVQLKIHPTEGFYAQSWLLFSESTSVQIDNDDIFVKSKANTRAEECYNSFYEDMEERGFLDDLAHSDADEAEEQLMAYIDSKEATKH
jgi:hypothetical protein